MIFPVLKTLFIYGGVGPRIASVQSRRKRKATSKYNEPAFISNNPVQTLCLCEISLSACATLAVRVHDQTDPESEPFRSHRQAPPARLHPGKVDGTPDAARRNSRLTKSSSADAVRAGGNSRACRKLWLAFDAFGFSGTIALGNERRAPRGGTSTEDAQTARIALVKRRCGVLEPALPAPSSQFDSRTSVMRNQF